MSDLESEGAEIMRNIHDEPLRSFPTLVLIPSGASAT